MHNPYDPIVDFTEKMLAEIKFQHTTFREEISVMFEQSETKLLKALEPLLRDFESRQQERNKYRQS